MSKFFLTTCLSLAMSIQESPIQNLENAIIASDVDHVRTRLGEIRLTAQEKQYLIDLAHNTISIHLKNFESNFAGKDIDNDNQEKVSIAQDIGLCLIGTAWFSLALDAQRFNTVDRFTKIVNFTLSITTILSGASDLLTQTERLDKKRMERTLYRKALTIKKLIQAKQCFEQ